MTPFQEAVAKLRQIKLGTMTMYYEYIRTLYLIKKNSLYIEEYPSFKEFVLNSRLGSLSAINTHIQNYETFFLDQPAELTRKLLESPNVSPTDLAIIGPQVRQSPESLEHWVHIVTDAESEKDIRKAITEKETGIAPETCDHENVQIKMTEQCIKCHSWKVTNLQDQASV